MPSPRNALSPTRATHAEPGGNAARHTDTNAMGKPKSLATNSNPILGHPPLGQNEESKQVKCELRTQSRELIIGTWNVRRGLIIRELEIVNLLHADKIDVLFLTETDIKNNIHLTSK